MRLFFFGFWLCLAVVALPAAELPVAADAHVNSAFPNLNFGNSPFLQVGGGTRTFLRFDTSALPEGALSSALARVNLVFWVGQIGAAGSLQVSGVSGAWDEATISWSNQPAESSVVGTALANGAAQFVSIDVTAIFSQWLTNPGQNFGLAIDGLSPATSVFLDSKESVTTSHSPALEIILAGPAGPAGMPGPAGSTGPPGPEGPVGAAGAQGATGPPGSIGATGPAGPMGAAGTPGAIGPAGPMGATGPAGPMGAAGTPGAIGPAGPMGATGPAGPMGAAGTPGAIGPAGPMGATGPSGPMGTAGTPGATGPPRSHGGHGSFRSRRSAGSDWSRRSDGSHGTSRSHGCGGGHRERLVPPVQWGPRVLQVPWAQPEHRVRLVPPVPWVPPGRRERLVPPVQWEPRVQPEHRVPLVPPGSTGATGPQGPSGPTGATGAQGPAGTAAIALGGCAGGMCVLNVTINGTSLNQAHVSAGAQFTVAFDYSAIGATFCPGCIVQYYVGLTPEAVTSHPPGTNAACFLNTVFANTAQTAHTSQTLTAPSTNGIYYVALESTLLYGCPSASGLPSSSPSPSQYLAAVAVY